MFDWLRNILFHHTTIYRIGEAVVTHLGGPMMVITMIHLNGALNFPMIECQWYDPETRSNRKNIFRESGLLPFDWDAEKWKLKK